MANAMPFPETAEELLTKARGIASPVATYGYVIAKTRELHGDAELAQRCLAYWDQRMSGRDATDIGYAEGVSAWRAVSDGPVHARLTSRHPETAQIQAIEITDF